MGMVSNCELAPLCMCLQIMKMLYIVETIFTSMLARRGDPRIRGSTTNESSHAASIKIYFYTKYSYSSRARPHFMGLQGLEPVSAPRHAMALQ